MKHLRTTAISVLMTVALLGVTASAVAAAAPLSVHIEVPEVIATSGEPFTATGAAVDAGAVCPSGTVDDLSTVTSGPPSGPYTILQVLKRFNCDDLSGTFDVRLVVRLDNSNHQTTASWRIVDGTGDYADLKGNGTLVGTPIVPGESIQDVYDGKVH